MTYNTPELLLVGAAQNFVLAGSPFELKNDVECKADHADHDGVFDLYDGLPTW